MNNCIDCNKKLPEGYRFETCKECYLKNKLKNENNENDLLDEGAPTGKITIDTDKKIMGIQISILIGTFILGVIIGAILW